MIELKVLQAVRLKGRITAADLAATLDEAPEDITLEVDRLAAADLLAAGKTVRITQGGRDRLAQLLRDERQSVDGIAMTNAYSDFRAINSTFKAVMTDWQLKDGQPNPHDDADYDAAIVERLHVVHSAVLPVIDAVVAHLPRLGAYRAKLEAALHRVDVGDMTWLARPLADSYHTVWFELHEELILAAGLTRQDEAQSG